jgi:hypothetical protein
VGKSVRVVVGSLWGKVVKRFILFSMLLIVAALSVAGAASAGGANNLVQVSASAANPTVIRAQVTWSPFGGQAATSANIASAVSTDCTGCRAVAVAFQVIILTGSPNVVTPANAAVAANGNCTNCDSFAFAYQDVVSTAGPATLSPAGIAALQGIQLRADAIAQSGEPDAQMDAELRTLALEFKADVEQNLVLHGAVGGVDHLDVQTADQ